MISLFRNFSKLCLLVNGFVEEVGDVRSPIPYIPIHRRRAASCAPIDRLTSTYGSWVFVSTSLVQELIWPCNDYDIVGRREPA